MPVMTTALHNDTPRTPERMPAQPARGQCSRLIPLFLGLAALTSLPACATYQPADPARAALTPEPIPAAAWPERITADLPEIVANTPKTISRLTLDPGQPGDAIDPDLLRRATEPEARITYNAVHGQGIIREVRGRRIGTSIRFVSQTTLPNPPEDTRAKRWLERSSKWWEQYLNEYAHGLKPTDPKVLAMLFEGTAIRITPPPSGVTPRGTILHMAGLGSMEYEQPLLDDLSRRGWYVLRIATPRVWWFDARVFPVNSRADIPEVGKQLARTIDDLVAESAYAAEAALDYIRAQRPEVPLTPLVMVGCSAGSLAAPAVVARQPDAFSAAVFVGGGANLLEISQTSDLTDGGIQITWPPHPPGSSAPPSPAWQRELFDAYLQNSTLDPAHSARALVHTPVLVVDANLDSTVPAKNAWLLWQSLGKPDRYNQALGHRALFFTLGSQSGRIGEWIDGAVAKSAAR